MSHGRNPRAPHSTEENPELYTPQKKTHNSTPHGRKPTALHHTGEKPTTLHPTEENGLDLYTTQKKT